MKKILVITFIAIFSFSNAQKRNFLVAGFVGYSNQKKHQDYNNAETASSSFNFTPRIGYQLNEHWTHGFFAGVSKSKSEGGLYYNSQIKNYFYNDTENYNIGLFSRYTRKISELFSVYGDFDAGLNFGNTYFDNNIDNIKSNGFSLGFTPALFLNLKNGFGLNFNIGGINYSQKTETFEDSNIKKIISKSFDFNFGNNYAFGISKNF